MWDLMKEAFRIDIISTHTKSTTWACVTLHPPPSLPHSCPDIFYFPQSLTRDNKLAIAQGGSAGMVRKSFDFNPGKQRPLYLNVGL